jgi:hypothetical protein
VEAVVSSRRLPIITSLLHWSGRCSAQHSWPPSWVGGRRADSPHLLRTASQGVLTRRPNIAYSGCCMLDRQGGGRSGTASEYHKE